MKTNARLKSFDELKFGIETLQEIEFNYKNLLYYIGAQNDGKYLIYANREQTMGHPIFVYDDVDNPYTFDFGDGKTLKDIWQDIEPGFNL